MGNMVFYLDGKELPSDVPYREPDPEESLESPNVNRDEKIFTNVILTQNASDKEHEMALSDHSISALAYDDKDIVCNVPYKKVDRKADLEAMRKKRESENKKTSTFEVSQDVIDRDREMCLFNHATPRLVYVNDVPETHFIFNGEEFASLEDLFNAKDRYGELLEAMLEQDEQCEDLAAEAKARHVNDNVIELPENLDISGLSVMVAYIISGLRQIGGKVTFGEERVDNAEYQFASKLIKEIEASDQNMMLSHIILALNQIGGEVAF